MQQPHFIAVGGFILTEVPKTNFLKVVFKLPYQEEFAASAAQ